MEIILFIGAQATGKSSFCRNRFFESHVRVNLDMLRTRHRERTLIEACLRCSQPFVIDNTNATRTSRERYFCWIRSLCPKSHVRGFYFQSRARQCVQRNRTRDDKHQVPDQAIYGTINRLELPEYAEGFAELNYVRLERQGFVVEKWKDEV